MGEPASRSSDSTESRRLREQGFLVLESILNPAAVSRLSSLAEQHARARAGNSDWVRSSVFVRDASYRGEVARTLVEAVRPSLPLPFLPDHEAQNAQWMIKDPGRGGNLLHRGPSFVDEVNGQRSYSVWIPLCDVSPENGALGVVPGSHRTAAPRRWHDETRWVRDLDPEAVVFLDLRAGDGVLFDHRLGHASSPNRSTTSRVAFTVGLFADPIVVWRPSADLTRLNGYEIGLDHFRESYPHEELDRTTEIASEPLPARERLRTLALLWGKRQEERTGHPESADAPAPPQAGQGDRERSRDA